jgi:hypothetical protein
MVLEKTIVLEVMLILVWFERFYSFKQQISEFSLIFYTVLLIGLYF